MNKSILITTSFLFFLVITNCSDGKAVNNKDLSIADKSVDTKIVKAKPGEAASVNHTAFNTLLKSHVADNGTVNYNGFVKDKAKLQAYIVSLTKIDAAKLTENEQLAYWANAYNALTIDQIIRKYPLKSIMNIADGKVWDQPLPYTFNGKNLTLNQIEKQKLIQELGDPRVHFIINCAAVSCPKLVNEAFTSNNIQNRLTSQTKNFLNNETFNKLSKDKAVVSNIFNWYKADFTKGGNTVISFINKYAAIKLNPGAAIDYMDYNWSLNGK